MIRPMALRLLGMCKPEIRTHATKLYLGTILRLQAALKGPDWHEPVVLHTCIVLAFYECISSPNPTASFPHVRGVGHIMQQKGPHSFILGLEHRLFRYYRINLLMISLHDHRTCFLAQPDWKTIPFSDASCPPKTTIDQLLDILVDIPGVIAVIEEMQTGGLGKFALIQKAFDLTYMVRNLIYDLETWKQNNIWTHSTICDALYLKSVSLLELCEIVTALQPYDAKLCEAINCYLAAHLILARIAYGLRQRSFLLRTALHPPYTIEDLISAITLLSERHISQKLTDMPSMIVTTFPLKVAMHTTEAQDPEPLRRVAELVDDINREFARRYNISLSMDFHAQGQTV